MTADVVCERCGAYGDIHWMAAPGHDGLYEVNESGQVRSWRPWRGKAVPRLLKPRPDSYGYPTVTLSGRSIGVHRVVMLSFVGGRPDGQEIRHMDGDCTHNCLANLAYGTRSENQYDRVRHGTHHFAAQSHCKQGHELTEQNTLLERGGTTRSCRTCKRARWHEWNAKRRSA